LLRHDPADDVTIERKLDRTDEKALLATTRECHSAGGLAIVVQKDWSYAVVAAEKLTTCYVDIQST
jgi:hypothetical protein